jgi:putative ABC transport system permease protein
LWTQRFGADPSIVGRRITLGAEPHEVIGVLPEAFRFVVHSSLGDPTGADVWVPGVWNFREMSDGNFSFALLVRTKPGVTLAQAAAELDTVGGRLDRERYKNKGFGWQLAPVKQDLVGESRPALMILLGAAGFVLLIVCANVASLMLVRAGSRAREMAVRSAIGAGRGRLMQQLLVESLVLSVCGGLAGAALAYLAVDAFTGSGLIALPRLEEIAVDARVLLFSLVVSIATGALFGLAPAVQATRADVVTTLKDAPRGSSGGGTRARGALVVAEVALALVLLVGATLLARTFAALVAVDPGFDARGVMTAEIQLPFARYPQEAMAVSFHQRLRERLAGIPGVIAVGGVTYAPLSKGSDQSNVRAEGAEAGTPPVMTDINRATPGYFAAMGVRLLRGRDFDELTDAPEAPTVAIVDETLARALWSDLDPLGRRITVDERPASVVGVVRHARTYQIHADDRPQVYLPYAQDTTIGLTVAVRGSGDAEQLGPAIRAIVREIDPNQPVAELQSMDAVLGEALADRRLNLLLVGGFAALALVLATLGIYGVIAAVVASRTREIGIRLALGAQRADVLRLVVGRGAVIAAAGVGIGLLAALALARVLGSQLYGVTARDPLSFGITSAALFAVSVMASYVPARRATRVDPVEALRQE